MFLLRWLGRVALLAGTLFFLQGFTLGGVAPSFGVILECVGFLLLLVLAGSGTMLMRGNPIPTPRVEGPDTL